MRSALERLPHTVTIAPSGDSPSVEQDLLRHSRVGDRLVNLPLDRRPLIFGAREFENLPPAIHCTVTVNVAVWVMPVAVAVTVTV